MFCIYGARELSDDGVVSLTTTGAVSLTMTTRGMFDGAERGNTYCFTCVMRKAGHEIHDGQGKAFQVKEIFNHLGDTQSSAPFLDNDGIL